MTDPNNLQTRDSRSDDKPEHTNGHIREDVRCSRPLEANYPEIMKVVEVPCGQRRGDSCE